MYSVDVNVLRGCRGRSTTNLITVRLPGLIEDLHDGGLQVGDTGDLLGTGEDEDGQGENQRALVKTRALLLSI